MGRPSLFLLILVAAIGSWYFFNAVPSQLPTASQPSRSTHWPKVTAGTQSESAAAPQGVVRVASFNLDRYDRGKSNRRDVLEVLGKIIRNFDVVALQEIACEEQHVVPKLVDVINGSHGNYDYVIGPRVGRGGKMEQFAFVFNQQRIDIDRYEMYSVKDPDDLIHFEPFVACFRARGVPVKDAFTFTLVNLHTSGETGETNRENQLLRTVFESVRNDRRGEDDVILMGDFQVDANTLKQAVDMTSAVFIVSESPTDPEGQHQRDNIFFDSIATTEFTGRSGVVDFLREMNLSMEEALQVSRHLPVWVEFSAYEGGNPRRMAHRFDGQRE